MERWLLWVWFGLCFALFFPVWLQLSEERFQLRLTQSYFLGNKLSTAGVNMKVERNTYQSVEAHFSTASRPVLIFWQISPSISEDCMILKTWLITEDSLRIRPMITHQSRQPASMKICSKYLYGKKPSLFIYFLLQRQKLQCDCIDCFFLLTLHASNSQSQRHKCHYLPQLHLWLVWPFTGQF